MQPYERARIKIISDLNLALTLPEVRDLGLTLKWLFNKGAAMALFEHKKEQNNMTEPEKELLEIKIQHLHDRKKLMTSEIDLKIRLLEEALALQKGFEVSGKYSFRFEQF